MRMQLLRRALSTHAALRGRAAYQYARHEIPDGMRNLLYFIVLPEFMHDDIHVQLRRAELEMLDHPSIPVIHPKQCLPCPPTACMSQCRAARPRWCFGACRCPARCTTRRRGSDSSPTSRSVRAARHISVHVILM